MTIRIVLAGAAGGVLMFLWMSAAHMSPLGMIGISALPRELLITSTLDSGAGGSGGLYVFPAAVDAGPDVPSGFMVFYPDNVITGGMGTKIGLEFGKELVQSLLQLLQTLKQELAVVGLSRFRRRGRGPHAANKGAGRHQSNSAESTW